MTPVPMLIRPVSSCVKGQTRTYEHGFDYPEGGFLSPGH